MRSLTLDDIEFAMEATRVIHEPDRRIDTFGDTNFEYCLVSELMDDATKVRVREGRMEAGKPRILRPGGHEQVEFEGFGEYAESFREWLSQVGGSFEIFQYGFRFATRDMTECVVHEPIEAVTDRVVNDIRSAGNPSKAVIVGVDDTWEISLLRFTGELALNSRQMNEFDFRRRGLL